MSVKRQTFFRLLPVQFLKSPESFSPKRLLPLLFVLLAHPVFALDKSPETESVATLRLHQSLLQDIALVGEKRLVVVGERGHIGYSDDNGLSWHQARVPTKQMLNAVYFVSDQKGWAVGYDGLILHTEDAGETWSMQLDGLAFSKLRRSYQRMELNAEITRLQRKVEMLGLDVERAADEGLDTEELEMDLEDAEIALEDAEFELDLMQRMLERNGNTANPLMDVFFLDEENGFAVGAFNTYLVTTDGGENWSAAGDLLDNPEGMHLNAIVGKGDTMMIAGEAGLILRSLDRGESWELVDSPDYGSFFGLYLGDDEMLVQVVGLRGAMYQSLDAGDSWEQIPEGLHKNMNAITHGKDGLVLAAGNDGAWFRSLDGGQSYDEGIMPDRMHLADAIEAANGDYIFIGMAGVKVIPPAALPVNEQ